jgi:hypothetical protein
MFAVVQFAQTLRYCAFDLDPDSGGHAAGKRAMTSYGFRIALYDSDLTAVEIALENYRKICEAEMSAGRQSPYWAHAKSIDAVLRRLHAAVEMTSTSSDCWPE